MVKKSKNRNKQSKVITAENPEMTVKWYDNAVFLLIALTIFIIPIYFNIQSYDQFELPKLTLLRILTSLMLGLWLFKIADRGKIEYKTTPLDIAMILLVISNIISTIITISPQLSFRGEYENFAGSLSNINYIILYFIASQFIRTKKQIYALSIVLLTSGMLVTIYAVAQFFGHDFINWSDASVIQGRYFASMGNPNFLGAFLIMVLPIIISFLIINLNKLFASDTENKKLLIGAVTLLSILLITCFASLLGTQSRGPALGAFAAILVFLIYGVIFIRNTIKKQSFASFYERHKKSINTMLVILAVSAVILFAMGTTKKGQSSILRLTSSFKDIPGSLQQSRMHIWVPAVKMMNDHPVFGTGIDTFKTMFPQYEGTDFLDIDGANVSSRTAHNELLNVAATQGVFGLGIYILLIIVYIRMWYVSFSRITQTNEKMLSLGIFAGFVAYFIQNLFSFGVAVINTTLYVFFAIHTVFYAAYYKQKIISFRVLKSVPANTSAASVIFKIAAISVSLLLSYNAWLFYSADKNYNRGKILGNMHNRWDLSVAQHELSVKKCPGEVKYHVYLGLAYERLAMQTQDPQTRGVYIDKAIAAYKNGVRLNPGNAYYWGNLARIYSMLARTTDPVYFNDAIKYYKKAIEKAPITGLFYNNLIDTYVQVGKIDEALKLKPAVEMYDKKLASSVNFLFGNYYFTINNYPEAARYYKRSVEFNPSFIQGLFNLGVVSAAMKDADTSIEYLERVLKINPDFEKKDEALKIIGDMKKLR